MSLYDIELTIFVGIRIPEQILFSAKEKIVKRKCRCGKLDKTDNKFCPTCGLKLEIVQKNHTLTEIGKCLNFNTRNRIIQKSINELAFFRPEDNNFWILGKEVEANCHGDNVYQIKESEIKSEQKEVEKQIKELGLDEHFGNVDTFIYLVNNEYGY